jgi:hypothetical protein
LSSQRDIPLNYLAELAGCQLHNAATSAEEKQEDNEQSWREVYLAWRSIRTVGQLTSRTGNEKHLSSSDPVTVMRQSGDFIITGHISGTGSLKKPVLRILDVLSWIRIQSFSHPGSGSKHFS